MLAVILIGITLATAIYGYVNRPLDEQPPSVPSASTFIVDLDVTAAMPASWVIRTNLIEDGAHSWDLLSITPQGRVATTFDFDVLAYGLPVAGRDCGLIDGRALACASGAAANAKFVSEEHGLVFPPQSKRSVFPVDGSIHEISGSAANGAVVLRFALEPGSAPVAHFGSFLSFSLPPIVLNVLGAPNADVNTAATIDTEIGMSELHTVTLASGNAPSSIVRDPAVSTLDPDNHFLTSWVWAESDPLSASGGVPATVQSTPVAVSAATNVATASAENHQAFLSGIAWGIAGGAAVGAFQEILTNLSWPLRRKRALVAA
jgi:hypothetical protein